MRWGSAFMTGAVRRIAHIRFSFLLVRLGKDCDAFDAMSPTAGWHDQTTHRLPANSSNEFSTGWRKLPPTSISVSLLTAASTFDAAAKSLSARSWHTIFVA
jgi:hypothetical protein